MAFLKFLGTAGTRFMVIEQRRASGGIWISAGTDNVLLDPGPGSLVRAWTSEPPLDPRTLTGIILTHRHLDHANDANVMIEAMTLGGREKRGAVFAPADALAEQPVIQEYLRGFPERIETLREGAAYACGGFCFSAVKRMAHPGETYGLRFDFDGRTVAFITDTAYFDGLAGYFAADLVVVNVVMAEPNPGVYHLSLPEAERIIGEIRPRRAVLTHFGRSIISRGPETFAAEMSRRLGLEVTAASDGLRVDF